MDNLEIARVLNVSVETVKRDWRFCKLWLATELSTES
jgi:DNA invertase Pin-like site-specific DNA recombinase